MNAEPELELALPLYRLAARRILAAHAVAYRQRLAAVRYVPMMFIEHGTVAFAAAACWHGFQYLGVVYMFSRRKHGGQPLVRARLVGWASQPGRGWAFMALLWGLAVCVYAVIFVVATVLAQPVLKVAGLTWLGLTLGHYWLDGLIWKIRKPAVAAHLT